MKEDDLKANTLYYSTSEKYVVEVKQVGQGYISTVTYKKEKVGMQPIRVDLYDSVTRVIDFLKEN